MTRLKHLFTYSPLLFFIIILNTREAFSQIKNLSSSQIDFEIGHSKYTIDEDINIISHASSDTGPRIEVNYVLNTKNKIISYSVGLRYLRFKKIDSHVLYLPIDFYYGRSVDKLFRPYIKTGIAWEARAIKEKRFGKSDGNFNINFRVGLGIELNLTPHQGIGILFQRTYSPNNRISHLSSPGGALYSRKYSTSTLGFGFKAFTKFNYKNN